MDPKPFVSESVGNLDVEHASKMTFADFKAALTGESRNLEYPIMVSEIPHESIFTSIDVLEQKKISNILVNDDFTDPVIGRYTIIPRTGQLRIIIHDGHHSSVVNYVKGRRRKFEILVIEKCSINGNMSLKKLADSAGDDLLML